MIEISEEQQCEMQKAYAILQASACKPIDYANFALNVARALNAEYTGREDSNQGLGFGFLFENGETYTAYLELSMTKDN